MAESRGGQHEEEGKYEEPDVRRASFSTTQRESSEGITHPCSSPINKSSDASKLMWLNLS
jgi:hypothetical protein